MMLTSPTETIAEQAIDAMSLIMETALSKIAQASKDTDGWLNETAAAAYLGRSLSWIKQQKKRGEFIESEHFYRKGAILFYRKEALDRWVQSAKGDRTTDGNVIQRQGKALRKSLLQRAESKKGVGGG
ncbi:MAG: helix-turn-helix domain-containing protein [Helicobacteraceae bacterium]|jgi:hypothetical protein|nr:helix-turn-helix domain-containing protein [Helicobacteraceae bacterium]